jgi:hypothetical protein
VDRAAVCAGDRHRGLDHTLPGLQQHRCPAIAIEGDDPSLAIEMARAPSLPG